MYKRQGKDSFQEIDIAGVTMPITKHNFIVKDVTKLADVIRAAFRIAKEGRPGPVLIDVTKDVTAAECDYIKETPKAIERQTDTIKEEDVERAVEMIKASKRPYVFVGGGVIASDASDELARFVKKIDAPVADSLMGKGAFDGTDPHYTGTVSYTHLDVYKRQDRDMPIIHLMQNTDSGITAAAEEVPQEKRLAGSQRVRLR